MCDKPGKVREATLNRPVVLDDVKLDHQLHSLYPRLELAHELSRPGLPRSSDADLWRIHAIFHALYTTSLTRRLLDYLLSAIERTTPSKRVWTLILPTHHR